LPDAHALALSTGITVHDATYLTLAVRLETQVITTDDRFARKRAEHSLLARTVAQSKTSRIGVPHPLELPRPSVC